MIPTMRAMMTLMEAISPEHWQTVKLHGVDTNIGWQLS